LTLFKSKVFMKDRLMVGELWSVAHGSIPKTMVPASS